MELEQEFTAGAADGDSTSPDAVIEEQGGPRDYEAEARSHGWTPKEEFKGDPSRWVDAETFARRADEVMPFLKKQNAAQKREIEDLKRQFKQASAHFSKAEERGFQRAMSELEAKHTNAVELGDVAGAKRAVKEMDELRAEVVQAAPVDETPGNDPEQARKELNQWMAANDWYALDDTKRRFADLQADLMGPAINWEGGQAAWLDELGKRVDRKFAEKKVNPVSNGGNREGGKTSARTFANLPPEAQRVAKKWVASGILKSTDDYVKSYQWES